MMVPKAIISLSIFRLTVYFFEPLPAKTDGLDVTCRDEFQYKGWYSSPINKLFERERQIVEELTARIVNSVRAERSLAARQRDIYDSHRHRAFSLAYYMTGNEIEAERILAQTFIQAFEAAPEPTAREIDEALLKELRKRISLDFDIPAYTSVMSPVTAMPRQIGQNIKRTDLEEAVASLPAMERFLFLLRDVEGYSPVTIAELLRLPESYVNRGVFTARARLRMALTARRISKSAVA